MRVVLCDCWVISYLLCVPNFNELLLNCCAVNFSSRVQLSLSLSWASSTFRLLNIYSSWDLFIVCVCHCVFNAHVVHFRFAAEQFHCLYFVFSWSTWSQSCKSNIVLCIYRHVRWRSLSRYCVFVCIVKQDTRIRRNKTANQPTEQK